MAGQVEGVGVVVVLLLVEILRGDDVHVAGQALDNAQDRDGDARELVVVEAESQGVGAHAVVAEVQIGGGPFVAQFGERGPGEDDARRLVGKRVQVGHLLAVNDVLVADDGRDQVGFQVLEEAALEILQCVAFPSEKHIGEVVVGLIAVVVETYAVLRVIQGILQADEVAFPVAVLDVHPFDEGVVHLFRQVLQAGAAEGDGQEGRRQHGDEQPEVRITAAEHDLPFPLHEKPEKVIDMSSVGLLHSFFLK